MCLLSDISVFCALQEERKIADWLTFIFSFAKRALSSASVLSGCSVMSFLSRSVCGASANVLWPQNLGGLTLPVSRLRGSLGYRPSPMATAYGSRGDTIVTNGAIRPLAKVPRGLVRLRLLNGANARNFDLRFSDERAFHVIASDGGFLSEPVGVSQLKMSPR
jgi:hypothetical protein